jgi:putative ABC transport system permease protein
MNHHPPRLARRIFKLLAGTANIDDLLGDLDEWFYLNLKTKSPFQSRLHYWKQVLSLAFSYALKKRKRDVKPGAYASNEFSIDMLRNYLKVAIRNLYQYKYFSFLNTFGLAIGMSVSLLLISLVTYVSTYDNFHEHKENIYTITSAYRHGAEEIDYATSPAVLADKMEKEFAGARTITRIMKSTHTVRLQKENIPVRSYYVEPDFFKILTFPINRGNAAALEEPNRVILTESTALKLFNTVDVLGETIELTDGKLFQVAGVMNDHPKNSHLTFEMLVSYASLPDSKLSVESQWTDYSYQYVYVLLNEETTPKSLQSYLNKVSEEKYKQSDIKVYFQQQLVDDIVMSDRLQAIGAKWEASGFFLFGVFAAMILLPACFNYTNISIARALSRAKEIGIRKTMGGMKRQIFIQFMTETVVIAFVSLVGAVLIFVFVREEFKSMLVLGSSIDLSLSWRTVSAFVIFALFTGFAAGIFPALYFARLNPIQALKSKLTGKGGSSMRVRKVLTIFQFVISFGLILSLVVFNRQYRYSVNFDFGFEKKNRIDVELQDVDPEHFRTAFSQLHPVQNMSMSSGLLGVQVSSTWIEEDDKDSTEVYQLFVDPKYIGNFGLTLLAGKNFPEAYGQQERYIIVNEEFIKAYQIDIPTEALGKIFKVDGNDLEVIGVVKNFHFAPLDQPIGKFFFRMDPSTYVYANLQVASTDAFEMFTEMEETWKRFPTEKKFQAKYFEDELNDAYATYTVLLKIVGFLGLLALTISLLGMLGMVVYNSETKAKEVSIRKVMGATVGSLVFILSKDYLKMMAWAILLAVPVTAYLISAILSHTQHYRITLNAWDIMLSAFILLFFGVATISTQTYKTAMTNPAEALRGE